MAEYGRHLRRHRLLGAQLLLTYGDLDSRARSRNARATLEERVKQLGGIVRKVEWIGHRGAPDRMVAWPSRPLGVSFPFFVELKAPGQKPEPHQEREHARMREAGLNVVVIDSFEGVDALLEEHT
jgi:hypothetical protein